MFKKKKRDIKEREYVRSGPEDTRGGRKRGKRRTLEKTREKKREEEKEEQLEIESKSKRDKTKI